MAGPDLLQSLSGSRADVVHDGPEVGVKRCGALREGPVPPGALPNLLRLPNFLFAPFLKAQKIAPDARSSMADDFAAGRATEIDFLNGEVVALARKHKRNPRVNAGIVQLVKEAETGAQRHWSSKELAERLLSRG